MAAIDKIYVNTWEQYIEFKTWCEKQPKLLDKYGNSTSLIRYVYKYSSKDNFNGGKPVFQGPYYADAYLIRYCPFDFIQKELMINYGYWSQEKINEAYKYVSEKNKTFYTWLSLDNFKIVDGVITMPNLEKSDYQKIKDYEIFTTPLSNKSYEIGKHFKCIKHPIQYFNKPYKQKNWFIDLILPNDLGYMWYHANHNSWDLYDEFVISKWSSSTAFCKTIKALKRLMLKWKLPVGTIVRVTGRYVNDEYKFIITK